MNTYDIYINSTIGWPFSAEYVRSELAKCKNKPCKVYISSLGGSVKDALQIRQLFKEHGDVTVYLHGFVASAATIIAMGAKKIVMGEFALFLIHRCSGWVDTWGQMNAEEIERAIKELESSKTALETIDQTIASIYAARCGKKVEDIVEWMKAAEWISASECLKRSLIDELCTDDCQADLDDAVKNEIIACGLPLPDLKPKNSASRSLGKWIRSCFSVKDFSERPEYDTVGQTSTKDEDYPRISDVINMPIRTENDSKVVLSIGQLNDLEERLASLSDTNSRHEEQIRELSCQIENLKAQDGDGTMQPDGVYEKWMPHHEAASAAYNLLKGIE